MLNELELTGRARSHVVQRDLGAAAHRDVIEPFLALKAAASVAGLDLQIVSGFRDFEAQLRIWNMKYRGERPSGDAAGNVRGDRAALDGRELVDGILCWSALPGASRHHWGTDIDVIDRAALPGDYRYRLLPEEYEPGGVFHRLDAWLEEEYRGFRLLPALPAISRRRIPRTLASGASGRYRPWHCNCSADLIAATLRESDVLGKDRLLEQLPDIYRRYVTNIADAHGAPGQNSAIGV